MQNLHSPVQYSRPDWVVSQYYKPEDEGARVIITNSKTWTHIELEGDSAEIWNLLPQKFSENSLLQVLANQGYATDEGGLRLEVQHFLSLLCDQFCLLLNGDLSTNEPDTDRTIIQPPWSSTNTFDVEKQFSDWLVSRGYLPHVMFELTYRCNQKCVHCFNPKESADKEAEISTQEIVCALDELVNLGVYSVIFTGGEVSLRDDLLDIFQAAKDRNLAFTVFTNGLQTSKWLDQVISLWPQSMGVSIYSADPAEHDAITQVKGSHVRSVEALRRLKSNGIRTTVKCPIMQQNATCLDGVLKLCRDLQATPEIDLQIAPSTNGDCSVCESCGIVDPLQMAKLLENPWTAMYVGENVPNMGRAQRPIDEPVCGAGEYAISIAPDGTVFPCNSLPLRLGNIRDNCLTDIVKDSEVLRAWRSVTLADYDECGAYARCSFCNHCPGIPLSEASDPLKASPTCCQNAEVRMAVSRALQAGCDPVKDLDVFLETVDATSKSRQLDPRNNEIAKRVVRKIQQRKKGEHSPQMAPEADSPREEQFLRGKLGRSRLLD